MHVASDEIGFTELRGLIWRSWKLILGLAGLFALVTLVVFWLVVPPVYVGTARLVVQPQMEGSEGGAKPAEFYTSLLESAGVLERTTATLAAEGVLTGDEALIPGEQIDSEVDISRNGRDNSVESFVLKLHARAPDPQAAARIANAWAEIFVEESNSVLARTAPDSQALLENQLTPTRAQLEQLESEQSRMRTEFQELEEKVSTSWDSKISSARKRAETAIAEYQAETRRQMEDAVARHLPETLDAAGIVVRSKLLEIATLRAQLAQTQPVLTLEKAASDETLAELIADGRNAESFDSTLVTQEINPLYDQLTVRALALEGEAKSLAGGGFPIDVAPLLATLEKIQHERSAGLVALRDERQLEVRTLRRRRGRELEKLAWERLAALSELTRRIDQMAGLETQLSQRLNRTVLSSLLQEVDLVRIAALAVPKSRAESRELPLKLAVALFLGGMLGLMIALFRSAAG